MPVFQIGAAVSLVGLYFLDASFAWALFRGYWILSAVVYSLVTITSYVIDPESAARSWLEGILFPGLLSLAVMLYAVYPPIGEALRVALGIPAGGTWIAGMTLFVYAWIALAMGVSYLGRVAERYAPLRRLAPPLILLGGYGAFLCAVTLGSYIKELQGADKTWDKTVKTGKVV